MTETEAPQKRSRWVPIGTGVIILSLLGAFFLIPGFKESALNAYEILTSDDNQRIRQWVEEIGVWGPLAIIGAMTVQMFLVVIPSAILMAVSVLAYGPWWGVLLILVAIGVDSSVGYGIGWYFGPVVIGKVIGGKKREKLTYFVEKYGFWVVVVTRFSPVLSNDAISFVGGLLRMGYPRFMAATLAGILPLAGLLAYYGERSDRLKVMLLVLSGLSLLAIGIHAVYTHRKGGGREEARPAPTA